MTQAIPIIATCLLFASCSKPIKNEVENRAMPTDSVRIPLQGYQYSHQAYQLVEKESKPILYGLDKHRKKINRFDLKEESTLAPVDYSEEKNNIAGVEQFFVHRFDSVYLFAPAANMMYLINETGELVQKWLLKFTISDALRRKHSFINLAAATEFNLGFVVNDKQEVFFPLMMFDGVNYLGKDVYRYPPFGALTLSDSLQEITLFSHFPDSYQGQLVPFDLSFNILVSDKDFWVNYLYSDTLFNPMDDAKIALPSKYRTNPSTFERGKLPNDEEVEKAKITDSQYLKTLYIPSTNGFLRVCKHTQAEEDEQGYNNLIETAPWSVLLSNEKGELIKELYFTAGIYQPYWVFPYQKGFFVLKENEYNPNNKEELFELDYFEF